ncbi:MAG: type I DNA topoisomerase [Alphaproteobacteria bacterium]
MDVVVVESPAKAKTINKYLGSDFAVYASYGHVRDLPAKNGSVDPEKDFNMIWQIDDKSNAHLKQIAKAAKGATNLYLATDPDREGEAISWHVLEILQNQKVLDGVDVKRIVFHEITQEAVLNALRSPRELDTGLVEAYLARRALDYLVGFTLSPILWRKLPGSRSAGRVQSVALRLVCDREREIEIFIPTEYWSVQAEFETTSGERFNANLTHFNGKKLDRFDLYNETIATQAREKVEKSDFSVKSIERRSVSRNPQPPFTTSTLQQEASRKLGFGAQRTMRCAQKLYEGVALDGETVGLITYMRTDSVNIAAEANRAARELIANTFGTQYVPETPNQFRNRSKNAQEAHEAIRPTDMGRLPSDIAAFLDEDGRRLYELIWKRAIASAMKRAELEQVAIDLSTEDETTILRATGQIVKFDGFLKLYKEDNDDPKEGEDENDRILPAMAEKDNIENSKVFSEQHFTKPPPRYTEASLVKKMEELGIGRPSTYASIISVLQDRNYVALDRRRFIPEDRGRVVTAFLSGFFERYIEYDFTAELEDKLDQIAKGDLNWKLVLREFWSAFFSAIKETENLKISDVIDSLDADLGPYFFPKDESGNENRTCPLCKTGRLGLKLGKSGPFVGCSNYPDCSYTSSLSQSGEQDGELGALSLPKLLGEDPETGKEVTLRKGPFGFYVQLGDAEGKSKPKRASLIKSLSPGEITLDQALALLALPREIGPHPESGEMISAGIGRFGPYLKLGGAYISLGPDEDILSIGLNRAVTVIQEKPPKKSAAPIKELGPHPEDGKEINIYSGRYGPYVKHGRINASIPKSETAENLSLERALELLSARASKGKKTKKSAKRAKSAKKAVKRQTRSKSADSSLE